MKVTIRCPHCQKALALEEDSLGRKVRCAACQTVFEAVRTKDGEAPASRRGEAVSPAALPPTRPRQKNL